LLEEMEATLEDCETSSNPELVRIADRFGLALRAFEDASEWLLDDGRSEAESQAGASPFLTLAGETVGGWFLAIGALAAQRRLKHEEGDAEFAHGKIALARYYAEAVLPLAPARAQEVTGAAAPLLAVPNAALDV
jgi:hypothetical protein